MIPILLVASTSACEADDKKGYPRGGQGARNDEDPERAATGGAPRSVRVHLVPRPGVSGEERVSFAVPLAPGALRDADDVRVSQDGVEIPSARRALARRGDGSIRSVELQVDVDLDGETDLDVAIGEPAGAGDLPLVPVADTLDPPDGTEGPRVWALLPAAWLSASGVAGPEVPEADVAGTPLAAWSDLCDYDAYDVGAFLDEAGDGSVWLYDRGTVMYRGYARRGDLTTLESAYRETAIYRAGITGAGSATDIGVPGKRGDLKYFYAQNMAIHYLLSGDDRFRESAEQIALKVGGMWDPHYDGSTTNAGHETWTERLAGFQLLAAVWAARVSDDRAEDLAAIADETAMASINVQEDYPPGYDDPDARCFAHHAAAHAEPFGYWGCSPWMSGILADGLDAYAEDRGGAAGEAARQAIVKLGRILAEEGRDGDGRPYYWMGVGTPEDEVDEYDEHWSESAYIVAMAYYHDGKRDPALREAAEELALGFGERGVAPHMRSFNWQCRSAVATPYYLR
jgi:hypothetical protein